MGRSLKKGPFCDEHLLRKIEMLNDKDEKKVIKNMVTSFHSFSSMVGHTIAVHDGRKHVPIYITEDMVGHKLGEFVPTRKFRAHGERSEQTTTLDEV